MGTYFIIWAARRKKIGPVGIYCYMREREQSAALCTKYVQTFFRIIKNIANYLIPN